MLKLTRNQQKVLKRSSKIHIRNINHHVFVLKLMRNLQKVLKRSSKIHIRNINHRIHMVWEYLSTIVFKCIRKKDRQTDKDRDKVS